MTDHNFAVGAWVQVWGMVTRIDEPGVHPDDVLVEFRSHNADWEGHVRKDRAVVSDTPPSFAERCTALIKRSIPSSTGSEREVYLRCELHSRHGKRHRNGQGFTGLAWRNDATDAYLEEA